MSVTRRSLLKSGMIVGAAGAASLPLLASAKRNRRRGRDKRRSSADRSGRLFGYEPFTQPVCVPATLTRISLDPAPGDYPNRTLGTPSGAPIAPTGNFSDVSHGIAPEFGHFPDLMAPAFRPGISPDHAVEFGLYLEETLHQFVPGGPEVPVFTYRDAALAPGSGTTPGPTVIVDYRAPAVLRCYNALTEAFRTSDYEAAVLHSAEIAHYVGAMYVPVNVSRNGDVLGRFTDLVDLVDEDDASLCFLDVIVCRHHQF